MRILIISDNVYIGKSVLSIIENHKDPECLVTISGSSLIDMKSEEQIRKIIEDNDLVISAHCKKIFPKILTDGIRCINIHPGFNPYNRGWYPQVFSLNNGLPLGATVHIIDDMLDHGDIIIREMIQIEDCDTSLSLYNKIVEKEIEIFERVFPDIVSNNIKTQTPEIEGNVNYKSDFDNLCRLDMNNIGTLREHLNLLRSLTHGEFSNAYFENSDGDKIYVSINLNKNV
jgi:methionyl-tRNA formyltransferase